MVNILHNKRPHTLLERHIGRAWKLSEKMGGKTEPGEQDESHTNTELRLMSSQCKSSQKHK